MSIVYFDLETKYLADEVGGWDYIDRLELAVAVTYNTARGGFAHYTEDSVGALIEELSQADLVVGFNLLRFDYTVLRPYTERDLHQLPTLDILQHLYRRLGHRVKLDSCARATLGVNKSADGIQSVQWFRAGHIDKVIATASRMWTSCASCTSTDARTSTSTLRTAGCVALCR
jgi:DEAD/DEAH box helicase domain-containing protein